MKKKTKKWYSSSANPENVSLALKGILVSLIPVAMIFMEYTNWKFTQEEIYNVIGEITIIVSSLMMAVGLIRKFCIKYIAKYDR